jgi:hypothetical protein
MEEINDISTYIADAIADDIYNYYLTEILN